jgi:hypothetical protein
MAHPVHRLRRPSPSQVLCPRGSFGHRQGLVLRDELPAVAPRPTKA